MSWDIFHAAIIISAFTRSSSWYSCHHHYSSRQQIFWYTGFTFFSSLVNFHNPKYKGNILAFCFIVCHSASPWYVPKKFEFTRTQLLKSIILISFISFVMKHCINILKRLRKFMYYIQVSADELLFLFLLCNFCFLHTNFKVFTKFQNL